MKSGWLIRIVPACLLMLYAASAGNAAAPQEAANAVHLPLSFYWSNLLVNQDQTTQLQNEEQIAINPTNPSNYCGVWRDFRYGYRQVAYGYTFDGGQHFTDGLFVLTQYPWVSDPGIVADKNGNFYAVLLGVDQYISKSGIFVQKSTDGGAHWGPTMTVVDNAPGGVFEDKELMACDRSNSTYQGNLYVTWARFGATTQIVASRSSNGGSTWLGPVTVSDQSGVQWPTPAVGTNGEVYIAWNRYTPSAIRFDRSTDGGATFGSDKPVASVSLYPGSSINGGILVFPYPAMDVDLSGGPFNGDIYIAYADEAGSNGLDIFLTKSRNRGDTWSTPVRVNDDPIGLERDQFHPWLTIDQYGVITIVFLDRRNDPANYLFDCYLTQSFDGGRTFSPNIRISTVSSDPNAGAALNALAGPGTGKPWDPSMPLALAPAGLLGEYIGVASSDGWIVPLWTDTRRGHQDAYSGYPWVSVDFSTATSNVRRGETLNCSYTLANRSSEMAAVEMWADVYLPNGARFGRNPVYGPMPVTLSPGETRNGTISGVIPAGARVANNYQLVLKLGTSSTQAVKYEDALRFNVVAK